MRLATEVGHVSKGSLWTGRVIGTLVVLFTVFDGVTKVIKEPHVIAASAQLGFSAGTVVAIGAVLLVCTCVLRNSRHKCSWRDIADRLSLGGAW